MHPSHPYTQEEACAAIYEALGGYCALPVGKQPAAHQYPPPTDYVDNQANCEADGGTWTSYSGKATAWYSLRSSHTYAYDPETERWGEAFVQGDEEKCEMQMACNWDPRGTATGGDESKCLDPSLIDPSMYHGQIGRCRCRRRQGACLLGESPRGVPRCLPGRLCGCAVVRRKYRLVADGRWARRPGLIDPAHRSRPRPRVVVEVSA